MAAKINKKIETFGVNTIGIDYVLGDIHGRFDLVYENLNNVGFNVETDRLFCVGDLIDRGPYSNHVVSFLNLPYVHTIRGNHEDMLLDFFETYPNASDEDFYHAGMRNGMTWFLQNNTCERKQILESLSKLPLVIEIESHRGLIGLVHADVPKDLSWLEFKNQVEADNKVVIETALWGRNRILNGVCEDIVGLGRLYVGHTVQENIKKLGNVVALDTGAVFDRHLTMVNVMCQSQVIINAKKPNNKLFNIMTHTRSPFGKMK